MRIFFTLFLCVIVSQSWAKDYTPIPPTENTAAANTPVVPWSRYCAQMVDHVPARGTAYIPDIDVQGHPVVPAEMHGGQGFDMPSAYRMFITSAQASKLNLNIPGAPLNGDLLVGEINVDSTGDMTFNGQPVEPKQIYAVCGDL